MQISDQAKEATAASALDDDFPRAFAWLIRIGKVPAIVLLTFGSIFLSQVITAICFYFYPVGRSRMIFGFFISTLAPLLIAPLMTVFITDMVFRLERARQVIAELASTDHMLTGVYNRRHFMHHANLEFEKARRYGSPLSLIMLDADHFKQLNDTYGHSAGDDVLRQLSAVCKANLRTFDLFARYGGEEFVILLPSTDTASARALAERIRHEIETMHSGRQDLPRPVTVSLGLAQMDAATGSIEELLRDADNYLYEAKENGRNRVEGGLSS